MNAPYTLQFDEADTCGCPWLVLDASGELMAGFETTPEAEAFADELNAEAADEAEALAWEAGRAEENERDNLLDDLAGLIDSADMSDYEDMGIEELRALVARLDA